MNARPSTLFDAFREDHAVLGRGLHEIAAQLRAGDVGAAKAAAKRLDRDAGAHIAFEERFFYPALRSLIGDEDVDRFYHEHGEGLDLVRNLKDLATGAELNDERRREMIAEAELMQRHVAECGELFGAMGRIPPDEQAALHEELLALRETAPRWSEFRAREEAGG